MKGKQMQEEIKNYLLMVRADRKEAGITKVPEFDERDIMLAYGNGLKSGLWHHSHDYLVKTAGNKEKYMNRITELEAQIEKMKNCENCAKRGHICVAEEMQGKLCGKNKDKWELRR